MTESAKPTDQPVYAWIGDGTLPSLVTVDEVARLARALASSRTGSPGSGVAGYGAREVKPFTDIRRHAAELAEPRGAIVPPANATTAAELARHVETIVCSFWPGCGESPAELVFTVALHALNRMRQIGVGDAITLRAQVQAMREGLAAGDGPAVRDRCQFCLGAKGGVPGEERVIGGALLCAECAELHAELVKHLTPDEAPEPIDAAAVGAMVRLATKTAAEHARQEEAGERIALAAKFGQPVTDADELEMRQKLESAGVAVCGQCMNTGWMLEGQIYCECPVGDFLYKKTGRQT